MGKSAGFLKKLKNVGKKIGDGLKWVNDKIVKPIVKPAVQTGIDLAGFGEYNKYIDKVHDYAEKGINYLSNLDSASSRGGIAGANQSSPYVSTAMANGNYRSSSGGGTRGPYSKPFGNRIN